MKEKFILEYEVDDSETEGTAKPIWYIVVTGNQRLVKKENLCYEIMSRVIGPFGSRKSAEKHRQARIYEYGKDSITYCASAYYSDIRSIKNESLNK